MPKQNGFFSQKIISGVILRKRPDPKLLQLKGLHRYEMFFFHHYKLS